MIGSEGGERVRSQRQRCTPRLTCSEQLSREEPGEEGRGIGRTIMATSVPGCGQLTCSLPAAGLPGEKGKRGGGGGD